MTLFTYEAVNLTGEMVHGEMEAPDRETVVEQLRGLGLLPVSAEEKRRTLWEHIKQETLARREKLTLEDLVFFTRELTTMLQAGLSVEKSMSLLADITPKASTKRFLEGTLSRMRSGASLADALKAQREDLPRSYIGMVRAGEAGGAKTLEAALVRLSDVLQKTLQLRESVRSALTYPVLLLVMSVLSIALILVYVLPQFEPMLKAAGDSLPASTRFVVAAGHFVSNWGLLSLLVLGLAILVGQRVLRRGELRARIDSFALQTPFLGAILAKIETSRFCRTLGSLQAHGVPLATSLPLATESFGNARFVLMAERLALGVREGGALSAQCAAEPLFPPLALHMIKIGEETGRLDAMLLKVADILDQDVQRSVERFMALLAPGLTILLGVIIAVIIASVLSAILSVNDLVL